MTSLSALLRMGFGKNSCHLSLLRGVFLWHTLPRHYVNSLRKTLGILNGLGACSRRVTNQHAIPSYSVTLPGLLGSGPDGAGKLKSGGRLLTGPPTGSDVAELSGAVYCLAAGPAIPRTDPKDLPP